MGNSSACNNLITLKIVFNLRKTVKTSLKSCNWISSLPATVYADVSNSSINSKYSLNFTSASLQEGEVFYNNLFFSPCDQSWLQERYPTSLFNISRASIKQTKQVSRKILQRMWYNTMEQWQDPLTWSVISRWILTWFKTLFKACLSTNILIWKR